MVTEMTSLSAICHNYCPVVLDTSKVWHYQTAPPKPNANRKQPAAEFQLALNGKPRQCGRATALSRLGQARSDTIKRCLQAQRESQATCDAGSNGTTMTTELTRQYATWHNNFPVVPEDGSAKHNATVFKQHYNDKPLLQVKGRRGTTTVLSCLGQAMSDAFKRLCQAKCETQDTCDTGDKQVLHPSFNAFWKGIAADDGARPDHSGNAYSPILGTPRQLHHVPSTNWETNAPLV